MGTIEQLTTEQKQEIALKHISLSRIRAWSSRKWFEKKYFLGEEFTNEHMKAGKRFDALRCGAIPPKTQEEKVVLSVLPNDDEAEQEAEFSATIQYEGSEYTIVGFSDYLYTRDKKIGEVKTSKEPKKILRKAKDEIEFKTLIRLLAKEKDVPREGDIIIAEKHQEKPQVNGEVHFLSHTVTDKALKKWYYKILEFIDDVQLAYPTPVAQQV